MSFPVRERMVTARLVLEPLSTARAAAVLRGDLSELRPGEGWPHADTWDGLRLGLTQGNEPGWLVELDGTVIGDCGTHGPPDEHGDVEIGYGLAEPYRGRGYGSELVVALAAWLERQPGVRRIVAHDVLAGNVASRRALERAGFVLESDDGELVSYARPAQSAHE